MHVCGTYVPLVALRRKLLTGNPPPKRGADYEWCGQRRERRAESLSFTLGAGQKLSDANHLKYRIRTNAANSREGILTYWLTMGDQFTPQDAVQQVTVKVGAGQ
jgi:hypothetical protein